MTARIAAHVTCHRTKAKVWTTAHPNETEAAMSKSDKSVRIRQLNDILRTTFVGGRVMVTDGVDEMPPLKRDALISFVRSFDKFTQENDPHGEHDFGTIKLDDTRYFWKIDYYSIDMEGGSEDPADPAKTNRVLTIMRADEY
jgi:Protein of unknown function (DUF3768)